MSILASPIAANATRFIVINSLPSITAVLARHTAANATCSLSRNHFHTFSRPQIAQRSLSRNFHTLKHEQIAQPPKYARGQHSQSSNNLPDPTFGDFLIVSLIGAGILGSAYYLCGKDIMKKTADMLPDRIDLELKKERLCGHLYPNDEVYYKFDPTMNQKNRALELARMAVRVINPKGWLASRYDLEKFSYYEVTNMNDHSAHIKYDTALLKNPNLMDDSEYFRKLYDTEKVKVKHTVYILRVMELVDADEVLVSKKLMKQVVDMTLELMKDIGEINSRSSDPLRKMN